MTSISRCDFKPTRKKGRVRKILKQSPSPGYSLTQMLPFTWIRFLRPREEPVSTRSDVRLLLFADSWRSPFVLDWIEHRFEIPSRFGGPFTIEATDRLPYDTYHRPARGHQFPHGNPWPVVSRPSRDQRRPVKAVCRGIRLKSERRRRLPFSSSLFGQRALPQLALVPSPLTEVPENPLVPRSLVVRSDDRLLSTSRSLLKLCTTDVCPRGD